MARLPPQLARLVGATSMTADPARTAPSRRDHVPGWVYLPEVPSPLHATAEQRRGRRLPWQR